MYDLAPSKNKDGALIIGELLSLADPSNDNNVCVILAGYKDDIEREIFEANVGMAGRFTTINFDDFADSHLHDIFHKLCKNKRLICDDNVFVTVKHRLKVQKSRGKGFSNARAVETLFKKVATNALMRVYGDKPESSIRSLIQSDSSIQLDIVDVIGPPPDENNLRLQEALDELETKFIGIQEVKDAIKNIVKLARDSYQQELNSQAPKEFWLHRIFVGNPGTGKTEIAKLYGRILGALGLLSKSECEYKTASEFIGDAVGVSAAKTNAIFKLSEGKVLIIDEAYALHDTGNGSGSYGKQVLDTICDKISGSPGQDLAVIMIGYEEELLRMFRESNLGLSSRFNVTNPFRFRDLTDNELNKLITKNLKDKQLSNTPRDVRMEMVSKLIQQRSLPNFGNARDVLSIVRSSCERMAKRDSTQLCKTDIHGYDEETLEMMNNPALLLNELLDVEDLHRHFTHLSLIVKSKRDSGDNIMKLVKNYVFWGNPGVGKTRAAENMGKLFYSFGLLPTYKCTVIGAQYLTGRYVGETKDKVLKYMSENIGGILFIDEAYNLYSARGGSFASEALDALNDLLTQSKFKNKMVVILAGYKDKLDEMFEQGNPGFKSRFTHFIDFKDWTSDSLSNLVIRTLKNDRYIFADETIAKGVLTAGFDSMRASFKHFGNARLAIDNLVPLIEDTVDVASVSKGSTEKRIITKEYIVWSVKKLIDDNKSHSRSILNQLRDKSEGFLFRDDFGTSSPPKESIKINKNEKIDETPKENEENGDAIIDEKENEENDDAIVDEEEILLNLAARKKGLEKALNTKDDDNNDSRRKERNIRIQQEMEYIKDWIDKYNERKRREAELRKLAEELERKRREEEEKRKKALAEAEEKRRKAMLEALEKERKDREEAERKRLAELKRLDEERKAAAKIEKERLKRLEKVKKLGKCPAGYDWIEHGSFYTCTGGSHTVHKNQL